MIDWQGGGADYFIFLAGLPSDGSPGWLGVRLYFPDLPKRRGEARSGSVARCAAEGDGNAVPSWAGTDFRDKPGRFPGRHPCPAAAETDHQEQGLQATQTYPLAFLQPRGGAPRAGTRGGQAALRSGGSGERGPIFLSIPAPRRHLHSWSGSLPPSSEPAMACPVFVTSHRPGRGVLPPSLALLRMLMITLGQLTYSRIISPHETRNSATSVSPLCQVR